ncbi:hypothetical protein HPT27_04805 [Permianibacter sp. IMCC34836]|uniref:hypothetical protein n=1 Tax=Permianibacter fluminis TaxID=2738515 RepID=UPI0015545732|nr:hypothetical protein [Permianibacter fluminis]NQD36336.1 hypothetical protein [Permianibacter fluminis]
MRTALLLSSLGFASLLLAPAHAADPLTGRPLKEDSRYLHNSQFLLSFGIQNGGNEMWALTDKDTGEQVDSSRAGGYTRLTFGGDIALGASAFSVEVVAGVLQDSLRGDLDSGKSVFKRKIIELIPFWNFDRHRVGVGAVAHLEPTFYANPAGPGGYSQEFEDAVGAVLQYDIRLDQNISVGARYTYISYEKTDEIEMIGSRPLLPRNEYSGNAFGIHITYAF